MTASRRWCRSKTLLIETHTKWQLKSESEPPHTPNMNICFRIFGIIDEKVKFDGAELAVCRQIFPS